VRPEQGLFTAIVAGFIISALGGSRVQIGGPTGAFVVIVAGIVAKFGYPGLAIATIMAGALLVAMSFARLGNVIKFIPYPVIIGFTSGIAIIIAMGQIGDGLGLPAGEAPSHFWPRCLYYIRSLPQTNLTAAAICLGSVLITQQWSRISRRLPGPLIALLLTTIVVQVFNLQVDTIGSRFGDVPTGLPRPSLPRFDFSQIGALFSPALSIALLGAIESLLSAMVADGMIGGRHRANAELMGQGIANLVVPFFGGIPATGAIARTATNVKNGGRSPVAGIVHSLTLLLILMAAGKWAAYIPLGHAGGHPARGGLQHERMARLPAAAALAARRRAGAVVDVRAHGGRRPQRGDPGGDGALVGAADAAHGRGHAGARRARRAGVRIGTRRPGRPGRTCRTKWRSSRSTAPSASAPPVPSPRRCSRTAGVPAWSSCACGT
jgi:SulP family sulfate permease